MTDINTVFKSLIQSHPKEMCDAVSFLEKEMDKRDCKFADKIVPVFIKPVFIPSYYFESLKNIIKHINSILDKTAQLYFSHPELKRHFCLNPKEEELLTHEHGYKSTVVIERPDAFFVDRVIRFVEFNCDSPAGPGYADVTQDIMNESFPIKQLNNHFDFDAYGRKQHLLDALLEVYHEFAGHNKKPTICIIDWDEVRTQNEFRIFKTFFESQGYQTLIADPRNLKYKQGRLEAQGVPIDLVYRRVIFRELMEKSDECQDFIKAFKDGKVCVVNPFRSRLASNKAILSIITNLKKYGAFYTKEEQKIIKTHIPWTRRVLNHETFYHDGLVFLKGYIRRNREKLVLKPSDSYGGKNVVIGCECSQEKWETLTHRILNNKEDWVVQRYVPIPEIMVPVIQNNTITLKKKKYNINPFVFGDRYAGSMSRLSDQSVINVSAGGGMVPVFQYHEKEPPK
ncbi:MAG: circularly permuted type 2 ATP-grasp protein [bacterium]|nr:glutathionylspermidine synthase family protein [bacterium]